MTRPAGVVDGTFAGTDLHAAYALQLSEIGPPHIPTLVEQPEHGPHASGLGKVLASFEMPFELRSYGWQLQHGDRITAIDQLRAVSHRDAVIQALADVAEDSPVPEVSVRLVGPVSLMAHAWLPSGQRILSDSGARTDIAAAWGTGVNQLSNRIYDVTGAVPTVLVQEDSAARAVAGKIRTASGVGIERAVSELELRAIWEQMSDQRATVLLDAAPELAMTAVDAGGLVTDWPQGRTHAAERRWEGIDQLIEAGKTVALNVERQGNPEHRAEELVQQYLDWSLEPQGWERILLVQRFDRAPAHETGAGLEWLRRLAEHAAGYVGTL